MARVYCPSCGKRYTYETNGCCPNCGAYNRPPKRRSVGADGEVHQAKETRTFLEADSPLGVEKQGKVCFEEKECYEEEVCFEEQARRVRGKLSQFAGDKVNRKRVIILGFTLFWVLVTLLLGLISRVEVSRAPEREERFDQEDVITSVMPEETFTLDGEDVRVTDWQIFGDEVTFVIQGREDLGVVLGCWDEDEEYNEITDFDVESLGSGAPLLDEILVGHAMRYTCSINGVCELEDLVLYGDNERAEVNTAMQRMSMQRHFGYQGIEISVDDLNMEREGPSKVLDDLYLDVGILSTDNDLQLEEMPRLWTRTAGGVLNAVEVERADYDHARCDLCYNLGRGEGIEEMTLFFPDCGDGAYWVTLK